MNTVPESTVTGKQPSQKERALIFGCDCETWKRLHTLTFDSQDASEQGWTGCPFCKKPFKVAA